MPAVHVLTFGCRANQADGAALAARLGAAGCRSAPAAAADWIVINTCTVTRAADAEACAAVRRLHRRHPQAQILVTGCYAERAPAELAALPGVTAVVGHAGKESIPALLAPAADTPESAAASARPAPAASALVPLFVPGDRTRPIVKVQEGCSQGCSFCVIPAVRGRARSLPQATVIAQVQSLVAAGYREVVLSGIHLGHWGRDLGGGARLATLVAALLDETAVARLRLSSVEPMAWDAPLVELFATHAVGRQPRLARHIHMPLQSGCDAVLRRMRRGYRPWHYAARVQRLQAAVPGATFGADVMVGFPGETEAEFEAGCEFIDSLPLSYLHVFPFSARPGTEAARRLGAAPDWQPVPEPVAAARRLRLLALMQAKQARQRAEWIGRRLPVITLLRADGQRGTWCLSDNYLRVWIDTVLPANALLEVMVTGSREDALRGVVTAMPAAASGPAAPAAEEWAG